MLEHTLQATTDSLITGIPRQLLRETYRFHDIRVICQTNHLPMLTILDDMLRIFPPPDRYEGEVTYTVLCYEQGERFPLSLPRDHKRTDTLRLLTNTRVKYYQSRHDSRQYLKYDALSQVNGRTLSSIDAQSHEAFTEIELPVEYQASFLRRYVFLLALGQLMHPFGFEPCHAGVVTAPWDSQFGALIIGGSGSGKTTLSVGCASEGFGLLGDDLVTLRSDPVTNSINACAISHEVSIRSATLDLWPNLQKLTSLQADQRDKRFCSIEQIRPGASRLQTAIRLLLFPSLTSETSSAIMPLSRAQSLQWLIDECLGKTTLPRQAQERMFSFLCALAEQAPGYQIMMARGANDGPQLVQSLMAGDRL